MFEEVVRSRFTPLVGFPIVFTSALTKQCTLKALEETRSVYEDRTTEIPIVRLSEEMFPLTGAYSPPLNRGKYIKIKYITQLSNTQVPSPVCLVSLPQCVKEPYKRSLGGKVCEKWDPTGIPANTYTRQK